MKVLNNIINTIMTKTEETIDYLNLEPMQQAKQLYDEGNANEAYKAFSAIVTEQPENGYAHYYIAMILMRSNLLGEALKAFNNAIKWLQDDKEWLSFSFANRACVYKSLGDKDQVLQDLEEAIRISPECAYAVGVRARFYQDTEQYNLSDQDFRRLSELRPGDAQPHFGIGFNAFLQEKYEEAKIHLDYAIKLDPTSPVLYTLMGECLAKQQVLKGAIENYLHALKLENGNTKAEQNLISSIPWEYEEHIISQLEILSRTESNNPYWPHLLGHLHFWHGKNLESIPYYEESFRRYGLPMTLGNISRAYYQAGKYLKSRYYAGKAIEMDPTNDNAQAVLAHTLMNMELFEEARQALENYLPYAPENPNIHYQLAEALRFCGDLNKALEEADTVVRLIPEDEKGYYIRAKIQHDLANFDAERKDLEKLLTIPQLEVIRDHYNTVHCKSLLMLGRVDEAKMELEKSHGEYFDYYLDAAVAAAMSGDESKATELLRQAFENGLIRFKMLRNTPLMEPLRQLPEFEQMLSEYEMLYHATLAGDSLCEPAAEGDIVPFTRDGDMICVRGEVNGLPLKFVFDTGASDITISSVEAAFMLKNGYLEERDMGGVQNYRTASGELVEGTIVNLREIKVGSVTFQNLRAAIIKNQEAPLLLGQSMLARMMMFSVNNEDMTINFITHSPIYSSYDLQCLAILEQQAGHHEESAKAFKLASEIETDWSLAFNAGYQYLLAVKTEEALGMFDKAIEYIDASDEDDKEISRMQMIFYKARTLTFAGRYEEALPLLEELEKEYPEEFAYPNMRGWMLRRMNRLEEAEEAINKSMLLGPDDANPYLEMALIRKAQGDDMSSNELLEKITQMPVSPNYANVMAEALWRLGRYEECRQLLKDQLPLVLAEREQEQCSLACMDAAVAYAVMGDDAEAEAMLEKSLEYTPVGLICTQDLEECAVLKRLDLYKTLIAQYA